MSNIGPVKDTIDIWATDPTLTREGERIWCRLMAAALRSPVFSNPCCGATFRDRAVTKLSFHS